MQLEDKDGLPWTASTHLGWIILVLILTFGAAILALGIYLSLWIRSKGRSALPLLAFLLTTLGTLAGLVVHRWFHNPHATDVLDWVTTILFIAAPFMLRREIQGYFRETQGWQPIINPLWTFFFSALYINYRLVPDRVPVRATLTSLNISSPPSLRK
jgi:hypothetical protein